MKRSFPAAAMFMLCWPVLLSAQAGDKVPPATQSDFVMRDFKFGDGSVLPELRIHYATLGTPGKGADGKVRNAVIVLQGTTGVGWRIGDRANNRNKYARSRPARGAELCQPPAATHPKIRFFRLTAFFDHNRQFRSE